MPDTSLMKAYPISEYTPHCATTAGAAVILMIMNNLDRRVAQFPEELVTYGGNGQVRRGRDGQDRRARREYLLWNLG